MSRLKRGYVAVLRFAITAMLMALLLIMGVQIVLRYGFSSSLIWAEESCRYLLIWISFLAVSLSYERGEIASVNMLRDALPRRAGLFLSMLSNALGVVLLAVLVLYGFRYAQRLGAAPIPAMHFLFGDLFGPDAPVPGMFWVYLALPVGMGMLAVRLLVDVVLYARMLSTGEHARDLRDGEGLEHG